MIIFFLRVMLIIMFLIKINSNSLENLDKYNSNNTMILAVKEVEKYFRKYQR